jgi:hypothetical protein
MSSGFFAFFQLILMPTLMRIFRPAVMYTFCMGIWPFAFALLPLLNGLARLPPSQSSTVLLWLAIAVVIICWRVACLAYPSVSPLPRAETDTHWLLTGRNNAILVRNNAPSPASLGAANGLNMLAMSVARCTAPALTRCALHSPSDPIYSATPSFSSMFALSVDNNLLGGRLWAVIMTLVTGLGFWVSAQVPRDTSS